MTKEQELSRSFEPAVRPSERVVISLPGASCAACALRAGRTLSRLSGVGRATVDVVLEEADVELDSAASLDRIIRILGDHGFRATISRLTLPLATDGSSSTTSAGLERRLARLPGVSRCVVDPVTSTAVVDYAAGEADAETVRNEIRTAGYAPGHPAPSASDSVAGRTKLRRAVVDALLGILLASASALLYAGSVADAELIAPVQQWIRGLFTSGSPLMLQTGSLALSIATLMLGARPLLVEGWRSVVSRMPGAAALSGIASLAAIAAGAGGVWAGWGTTELIPAAAALGAFYLATRAGGIASSRRSTRLVRALDTARPRKALRAGGKAPAEEEIEAFAAEDASFSAGAGRRIAVDGVVISGQATVDESILGGSASEARRAGDEVIAGTLVTDGAIDVAQTEWGSRTIAALAARILRDAGTRSAAESRSRRAALVVVPILLCASIAAAVTWLDLGRSPALAIVAAISVLVAFPVGALHLCASLSIRGGREAAGRRGVVVRDGKSLETAARVSTVVLLDSALSDHEPVVTDFVLLDNLTQHDALRLAAAALFDSPDPVARAVVARALRGGVIPGTLEQRRTGRAIVAGRVDGHLLTVGHPEAVAAEGISIEPVAEEIAHFAGEGKSPLVIGIGGVAAGVIAVSRPTVSSAAETIGRLRALGVRTVLATSDSASTAAARGALLGAARSEGELDDRRVLALISGLRRKGETVAVFGSGIGDRRALARADLAVSLTSAGETCFSAATLLVKDRARIADLIAIARDAIRRGRRTIAATLVYGAVATLIAGGALLPLTGLAPSPAAAAAAAFFAGWMVRAYAVRNRGGIV